jgi:hypothetical protein
MNKLFQYIFWVLVLALLTAISIKLYFPNVRELLERDLNASDSKRIERVE